MNEKGENDSPTHDATNLSSVLINLAQTPTPETLQHMKNEITNFQRKQAKLRKNATRMRKSSVVKLVSIDIFSILQVNS